MALSLALAAAAWTRISTQLEGPIVTDRPDFTESAVVVPEGRTQIESGVTFQSLRGGSEWSGPELLIRRGLSGRWELRVGLPNWNRTRQEDRTFEGVGDAYLGLKYRVGPMSDGSELALIPAVWIPSHDSEFSSGRLDPELKICWAREIDGTWNLAAMAGFLWTRSDGRTASEYLQTIAFSRGVGGSWGAFLEYAGTFIRGSRPEHMGHLGFTFQPNENSQWDVHGGAPLAGPDRRPFFAAGYSVRF